MKKPNPPKETPAPAVENPTPPASAAEASAPPPDAQTDFLSKPPLEGIDPKGGPAAQALADAPAVEVTGETIAKPLAEAMPAVSENAQLPSGDLPGMESGGAAGDVVTDKSGKAFDPARHKVDGLGAPRFSADGYFIPVDKGRPPSAPPAKNPAPVPKKPGDKAAPAGEKKQAADYVNTSGTPDEFDLAAKMYFKTALVPLVALLSDEWQPDNEAEEKTVVDAIACYLRARGSVDLTPGQALCMAGAVYAAPRLSRPKTKDKLTLLFLKVRGWFGSKAKLE